MVYLLGISTFISFQKNKQLNLSNVQYVTENITISNQNNKNKNDKVTNVILNDKMLSENKDQFLNIKGQNFDTTYRIYIDSTDDKTLPSINKSKDYLIGKGKKDDWYNHFIVGLSLDVSNYASNKNEFLNKYKSLTISYLHASNFWNSLKGWTNLGAKMVPLEVGVQTFNLTANDQEVTIFNKSDDSHSNNERTRLIMRQTWNGNVLDIDWLLGVWYHWSWGSVIHHLAFAQFTNDNYVFSAIPKTSDPNPDTQVKSQILFETSKFSLINSAKVQGLSEIDKKLINKSKEEKIRDSLFKFVPLFTQSYTGVRIVASGNGIIIYSLAINIIWYPGSTPSLDSLLLLNNFPITRTITYVLSGSSQKFVYENNAGVVQETNSVSVLPEFLGLELYGILTVPFIYLSS